jgi:hypothetical protein
MALIDLKTDLKSLKYSKDTIGGGDSPYLQKFNKLPWVKNPIPEGFENVGGKGSLDQLYRGGGQGGVTEATLRDTRRITNFLTSENGLIFLAKQAGLTIQQNIELYGLNPTNWRFIYNPASPLVNTTLAPTGIQLANVILLKGGSSGVNSGPGYLYGQPEANIPRESNNILGENKTFFSKKDKIFGVFNNKNLEVSNRVDRITATPLYTANNIPGDIASQELQDTVLFKIVKIDNSGKGNNTIINFRSYIEGLSDSYKAEWASFKYMGRGENFYFYNGFDRDISSNFTVPVISKYEQQSVYQKLNYLASLMAPDYVTTGTSNQGFMRGNIIKLTIGDYLLDVPGVLTSLNYTIDEEGGWDIARNSSGKLVEGTTGLNDSTADTGGWVMPKIIRVSGFSFKPIHTFIPKTVNIESINQGGQFVDAPFINFGKVDSSTTNGFGYGTKFNSNNASQNNTNTAGGTTS